MSIEENAMQILNALAPLSRRDEWWATDGPFAVVEMELRRLYPENDQSNTVNYKQTAAEFARLQAIPGPPNWKS